MPRRSRKDRRGRPWDPQRLPLRKSLLGRLLAVSVLVAACSVAATAWLAVQTTSGAIKQEQGQNLTADARIYNELLGFAAGHPDGTTSGRRCVIWPASRIAGSH